MCITEYELSFVIPSLSGLDDPRLREAEVSLDAVVGTHSGLTLVTVTAEGNDAVSAGLSAAALLTACGLVPTRTQPDLVSRQDIADRAQVTRQAVGNWARGERHSSDRFPTPVHLVGGGLWLWGDVVAWLRRNNHETDEIEFPTLEDHTRLDMHLLRESSEVAPPGRTASLTVVHDVSFFSAPLSQAPVWGTGTVHKEYDLAI